MRIALPKLASIVKYTEMFNFCFHYNLPIEKSQEKILKTIDTCVVKCYVYTKNQRTCEALCSIGSFTIKYTKK